MTRPLITLLTDFGTVDHYVAALKGVILGICPEARIVDVTHEIPAFSVAEGAFTLLQAWRTFPPGTVHVAVVDPGVGGTRRPLVVKGGGNVLIGPDNGLFSLVLEEYPGIVREITAEQYFRKPVNPSFHGRDVFAPVAARVAQGVRPESLGPRVDDWVRLPDWKPLETAEGLWTAPILKVDRFGNLITGFGSDEFLERLRQPFEVTAGSGRTSVVRPNYEQGVPGEIFVIAGSAGYLEISVNRGNCAQLTGVKAGDPVQLRLA